MKPLLAATMTADEVQALTKFPVYASPKIDGIRCLVIEGLGAVSRKLKPIPNKHIREYLSQEHFYGLDGELVTYTDGKMDSFSDIASKVMSQKGTPEFKFLVFDNFTFMEPFHARIDWVCEAWKLHDTICPIEHIEVSCLEDLQMFMDDCIEKGYEGVCFRKEDGHYKHGRSTAREGILVKWKLWVDAEGVVVGFEEGETNTNELGTDELGHAKRSQAKGGMVKNGTLGVYLVQTEQWGVLKVSSFGDAAFGMKVWANKSQYLGKVLTFKYQPHGMKEKPRIPIGLRFKDDAEL